MQSKRRLIIELSLITGVVFIITTFNGSVGFRLFCSVIWAIIYVLALYYLKD